MRTLLALLLVATIGLGSMGPSRPPTAHAQEEGGLAQWLEMVAGGVIGHLTGPAGEIGFQFLTHPCETYWGAIASAVRAAEIEALTQMASDPTGRTQAGRDAEARWQLLRTLSENWLAACNGSETARAAIRNATLAFKRYAGLLPSEPTPVPSNPPAQPPSSGDGDPNGGSSTGSGTDGGGTTSGGTDGGGTGGTPPSGSEQPCDPCKDLRDKLAAAEAALAANLAQQAALQAQIAAMQASLAALQTSALTGYRNRHDPNHGLLTDQPGGVDPDEWEQIWQSQPDQQAIAALQGQIAAAQAQLAAVQAAAEALREQIEDLKRQLEECEKKHQEGTLENDPCPPPSEPSDCETPEGCSGGMDPYGPQTGPCGGTICPPTGECGGASCTAVDDCGAICQPYRGPLPSVQRQQAPPSQPATSNPPVNQQPPTLPTHTIVPTSTPTTVPTHIPTTTRQPTTEPTKIPQPTQVPWLTQVPTRQPAPTNSTSTVGGR